ncbi:phosphatidylinositol phosphate synthase [Actinomyces minihominis]|uniref:phosphatidylinositol phosphate synthase n=1 Tax=Actinomyces minihominis TaxID=2002838 RepID=UPI000C076ECD|nr:CDP-alcohol phosphatidyltransferase family protein [Actinomyces minihominis]
MLGNHGRSITQIIFTPVARVLARMGVTPNMVTYGSAIVVAGLSFGLLARGYLALGGILLGIVLFADSIDGVLARMTGTSSKYGAFLDSTMDRITDGIVFGSLLWWAIVGLPDGAIRTVTIVSGIICMVAIGVVPYARSRAENFGVIAKVGIAERTDRLIVALVGAGFTDFGLPEVLFPIGMTWVAFASCVTVVQRMVVTHRALGTEELEKP